MSALGELARGFFSQDPLVMRLENAQNNAMLKWPGHDGNTYCNLGLIDICHAFDCRSFDGMVASEIVRKCQDSEMPGWVPCSWLEAADWAKRGNLAFLGWANPVAGGHGHIASVAARGMQVSPSWRMSVPILANIGKPPNDFKMASACFLDVERSGIKAFRHIG